MNFLFILIAFLASVCCHAQQIKTQGDVKKIKENEHQFLNNPLGVLLKEIKPQIKRVTANPSKNIQSSVGYFIFNFVDNKQKHSIKAKGKTPLTLVVYIKEYFDWDFQKREKGKEFTWTKKDEEKYGNFTIVNFRVYGVATDQ